MSATELMRRRVTAASHEPPALAVTGWSAVSAFGLDRDAFAAALAEGRSGEIRVGDLFDDKLPGNRAFVLHGFSPRDELGRKGTSTFDRTTGLAVCAIGRALEDQGVDSERLDRERIGLVVGTTTGSIRSTTEFSRETLVNDRPYLVNPSLFPNTVMNCAAGRAAIWYGLKGVNATVAGGPLSALQALRYARNALRNGGVDVVVAAAVEEVSPQSAWAQHQLTGRTGAVRTGEGCGAFVLERADAVRGDAREAAGEVLAVETRLGAPLGDGDGPVDALAACLRAALRRARVLPRDVATVATGAGGWKVADVAERAALDRVVPVARELRVKPCVGECFSASGAFQLAGLLADGLPVGRVGLVTSVSSDGSVGVAVARGWVA